MRNIMSESRLNCSTSVRRRLVKQPMAKRLKDQEMPPVDRVLRDAFEAVETEPVPEAITTHVDRLAADPKRADKLS